MKIFLRAVICLNLFAACVAFKRGQGAQGLASLALAAIMVAQIKREPKE